MIVGGADLKRAKASSAPAAILTAAPSAVSAISRISRLSRSSSTRITGSRANGWGTIGQHSASAIRRPRHRTPCTEQGYNVTLYREDRHPDGEFVRLSLESYPCLMADEMKTENRASA